MSTAVNKFQMGAAVVAVAAAVATVAPVVAPTVSHAAPAVSTIAGAVTTWGSDVLDPQIVALIEGSSANATAPTLAQVIQLTITGVVDGLRIGVGSAVWGAIAFTGAALVTVGSFLPLIGSFVVGIGNTVNGIANSVAEALRVGPYLAV